MYRSFIEKFKSNAELNAQCQSTTSPSSRQISAAGKAFTLYSIMLPTQVYIKWLFKTCFHCVHFNALQTIKLYLVLKQSAKTVELEFYYETTL